MTLKRSLSILLALTLLLGYIGWIPAEAVERENEQNKWAPSQTIELDTEKSEKHSSKEEFIEECKVSGIFQYIDAETFQKADHVARLAEEEELNTYVFQNQDGTKSIYYMEQDVKFIAPNGDIRDKDITLEPRENGYGMRDNDVNILLPNLAEDGIAISHGSNCVQLVPQGGAGEAKLKDNSIIYVDFYGEGTTLKYSPMLSGVKEDIILDAYTGVNSFVFILYTGGLGLFEADGQHYLAEDGSAEVFYLGEIIVYDAIGCPSVGSMQVETLVDDQAYRLTISADEEFLTAPTTVYPVTIDPTITITDSAEGGVIEDAPIFEGYPDRNFGNYVFNTIGYTDENYGVGRTVVRLNGLLDNEIFASIDSQYINRVEFYIKDAGSNSTTVNIHALTSNSTWTESTITWSNVGSHSAKSFANATMGSGAWSSFDITVLAKLWNDGFQNGQCGFIMIGAEEDTQKIGVLSCEYGTGEHWPYVVVTYTPKININCESVDVEVNYSIQLTATTIPEGMNIMWMSSDSTIATVLGGVVYAHKAGTVAITASVTDGDGQTHEDTCTVNVFLADGVYYFRNMYSGHYLGVHNGAISNQASVSQQTLESVETAELQYYAQLWKVKHLGNGHYSLRPMHRLSSALCAQSGNVVICDIGTDDSTIPNYAKWKVQYCLTGYVLQCGGDSDQSIAPLGFSRAANAYIYATAYTGASTAFRWSLTTVSEIDDTLLLIDTENNVTLSTASRYVAPDETRTMEEMGLALSFVSTGTNAQLIMWNADGSNTHAITYNSSDQSVTGVSAGQTTTLNFCVSGTGTLHTKSMDVHVAAIPNGTYFLQNKQTEYYADFAGASIANGLTVFQFEFHGQDTQQWVFTHLGDGYYSIQSPFGDIPHYLGVENDSSNIGASVVLRTGPLTDGMKWMISSTDSGAYVLKAKSCNVNSYVLNVNATMPVNYVELLQNGYTHDTNYQDEWVLIQLHPIQLSTPHIRQTESMWCWAACAQMLARTYWPTTANIDSDTAIWEQRLAVYTVKGDSSSSAEEYDWENDGELQDLANKGGAYWDVVNAAEVFTNMAGGEAEYRGSLGRLSEAELFQSIYDGNPVVILYLQTESEEPVDELFPGHVMIITGVYWNEEDGAYYFTVFDPQEGTQPAKKKYEDILTYDTESGYHFVWGAIVMAE